MTTATLPSGTGIVSTYSYDNADRLTGITHVKGGSTTVASVSYTLDDVGNRTQRVDQAGTHSYSYDDLYRLTSVTYPGPATTSYAFDAFGNRTSMTVGAATTSYSYDDADRITAVTPPSPASAINYTWDDNGDLTARGSDSFSWDYEDRMVSATVSSVTTTFAYRGDGLRNSKTTGGNTTTFTWDVAARQPVVLDDGNQYLYGAGLVAQKQSGNWYYYLSDGLGSTMETVDASGSVVNAYEYDIYGAKTSSSGSQANEFDFAGQQTDGSTGLQYLRARYYDPETGTFLSREPMASRPAWAASPYGYAAANSVNAIDPSGMRVCWGDGPEDCEENPRLPQPGARCGPSWNCGQSTPPPPAGSSFTPGSSVACTMTPPANCGYPPKASSILDLINGLTGEYRGTALSLLDLVPIAEACAAAGGPAFAVAYAACQPLESAIGTLAFAYGEQGIQQSGCSPRRKGLARIANVASFLADSGAPGTEVFETMLYAAQNLALTC